MGWESEYKESDIVKDYTKVLSKLWDNLMPRTYPYVLKFETKKAVEVYLRKRMGPYHMDERFIDYNCSVLIDEKPLIDAGWNGEKKISKELTEKAYGKNYFHNMRMQLVELSKYANINFSHFDFGGILQASVKDMD